MTLAFNVSLSRCRINSFKFFEIFQAIKKPDESKVPVPINEPVASGSAVNPREPVAFEEPLDGNDEGLEPAESAWGGGRGWGGGYGRGWGGGWGGGYGRGWGGGKKNNKINSKNVDVLNITEFCYSTFYQI